MKKRNVAAAVAAGVFGVFVLAMVFGGEDEEGEEVEVGEKAAASHALASPSPDKPVKKPSVKGLESPRKLVSAPPSKAVVVPKPVPQTSVAGGAAASAAPAGGAGAGPAPTSADDTDDDLNIRTALPTLVAALQHASPDTPLRTVKAADLVLRHAGHSGMRDALTKIGVVRALVNLLNQKSLLVQTKALTVLPNFLASVLGHSAFLDVSNGVQVVFGVLSTTFAPAREELVVKALVCAKSIALFDPGSKAIIDWSGHSVLHDLAKGPRPSVRDPALQVFVNLSCHSPSLPFLAIQWPGLLSFYATEAMELPEGVRYSELEKLARVTHTLSTDDAAAAKLTPAVTNIAKLVMMLLDQPAPKTLTGNPADGVTAIQAFAAALKALGETADSAAMADIRAAMNRIAAATR